MTANSAVIGNHTDYQLPLFAVSLTTNCHYLQSVWLPITATKKILHIGKKSNLNFQLRNRERKPYLWLQIIFVVARLLHLSWIQHNRFHNWNLTISKHKSQTNSFTLLSQRIMNKWLYWLLFQNIQPFGKISQNLCCC